MNKLVRHIITKEPDTVIRGLLMDLIDLDKRNEERVLILYHKY